jgi:hypothetical protein
MLYSSNEDIMKATQANNIPTVIRCSGFFNKLHFSKAGYIIQLKVGIRIKIKTGLIAWIWSA